MEYQERIRKKIQELAQKYDSKLDREDKRFNHSVQILHCEGTNCFFHNAFMMHYYGEHDELYIIVFTKTQGFRIFEDMEELLHSEEFINIENHKPEVLPR